MLNEQHLDNQLIVYVKFNIHRILGLHFIILTIFNFPI